MNLFGITIIGFNREINYYYFNFEVAETQIAIRTNACLGFGKPSLWNYEVLSDFSKLKYWNLLRKFKFKFPELKITIR